MKRFVIITLFNSRKGAAIKAERATKQSAFKTGEKMKSMYPDCETVIVDRETGKEYTIGG